MDPGLKPAVMTLFFASIIWFNKSNCHPGSLPGRGLFLEIFSTILLVKNGSRPEDCRDDNCVLVGFLQHEE